MTVSVTVDDSGLRRAVSQLEAGIETGTRRAESDAAQRTAEEIRNNIPKRSGRLAATVRPVSDSRGGSVTYGGDLPYARYIEGRTHAVANAVDKAAEQFPRDCARVAETEVRKV